MHRFRFLSEVSGNCYTFELYFLFINLHSTPPLPSLSGSLCTWVGFFQLGPIYGSHKTVQSFTRDNYVNTWGFFTSALVVGHSLESEWQQVSTGLQDTYSGLSYEYLVSILPPISCSSIFIFRLLGTVPSHQLPLVLPWPTAFLVLKKGPSIYLSISFIFILWSAGTAKSTKWQILFCACAPFCICLQLVMWSINICNSIAYYQFSI